MPGALRVLQHPGPVLQAAAVKVEGGELADGGVHAVLQAWGTGRRYGGNTVSTSTHQSVGVVCTTQEAGCKGTRPQIPHPRTRNTRPFNYLRVQHVHWVPRSLQPLEQGLAVPLG